MVPCEQSPRYGTQNKPDNSLACGLDVTASEKLNAEVNSFLPFYWDESYYVSRNATRAACLATWNRIQSDE